MIRALGKPVNLGARNVAHRDLCSLCALADIAQHAGWGESLRDEHLLGRLAGAQEFDDWSPAGENPIRRGLGTLGRRAATVSFGDQLPPEIRQRAPDGVSSMATPSEESLSLISSARSNDLSERACSLSSSR